MRPTLHFTARSGWINDPHGITFRHGRYDVFFQYVPDRVTWAPECHWGHASGPDLLSLTQLENAIAPGDGDDGIWTGCVVADDSREARAFYTATTVPDFGIGTIRTAMPRDESWVAWQKGPIAAEAPADLDLVAYRDPFVRRVGPWWEMYVGAGSRDGRAMVLLYSSDDLESWAYAGPVLERSASEFEPVWMGSLWECPQLFEVGGSTVMLTSVWHDDELHYAAYAVGEYVGGRFDASAWGRATYGDSYYAPSLFRDAEGRACVTFWMRGIEDPDRVWAGAHSVPYLLDLSGEHLILTAHPDVAAHRGALVADGHVEGLAADIEWTAPDGGEIVVYSGGQACASVFARASELILAVPGRETTRAPGSGNARIMVDGPIIEIECAGTLLGGPIAPAGETLRVATIGGQSRVYPLT